MPIVALWVAACGAPPDSGLSTSHTSSVTEPSIAAGPIVPGEAGGTGGDLLASQDPAPSHPERSSDCDDRSSFPGDAGGPFDLPEVDTDLMTRWILKSEDELYGSASLIVVAEVTGRTCIESVATEGDSIFGPRVDVAEVFAMELLEVLEGELAAGEVIWVQQVGASVVGPAGEVHNVLHIPTRFLLFLDLLEFPSIGVVSEQWVSVGFIGGIYLDLRQSDAERFSRIDPAATALPAELTRDEVRAELAGR